MSTPIQQVGQFMNTFKQDARLAPQHTLSAKEMELRLKLIAEELDELADSFGYRIDYKIEKWRPGETRSVKIVDALDALTDLRYVIYGTFHTLGLADIADEAFEEVHRSNMTKGNKCPSCHGSGTLLGEDCVDCHGFGVVAQFNADGKIVKPATYSKPNLYDLLMAKYGGGA